MTSIDPAVRNVPAPVDAREVQDAVRVFVSYSHKDPAYLRDDSLLGFLKGLSGEAGVEFWTDERITASSLWNDEIRSQLERCDIALVLVSQSFLDSPFCTQIEIGSFLSSCRKRGLVIFPVVLSPCEWERHEWLATRQFLPGGNETIEEHYTDPGKQKRLFLRVRKELRQAVESVRQARAAAAAAVPVVQTSSFAEKRQVTFLRCDLLPREPDGSPLDPGDAAEVLHELMPEFDKASRELFAQYHGHVADTGAGGTLVCFGYPEVAEDDSRRAVRAGLELVTRIAALSTRFEAEMGVALTTRVAVHTGMVVTTQDHPEDDLARGDAAIKAMVLQREALPNSVVISSSTSRLVEPFFEIAKAGSIRVPGSPTPLEYSQVLADKGFETRFQATASRALTEIVGRDREMDLLLDRWNSAREGSGGVVILIAEAGLGKSRLLKQVRTRVPADSYDWWEWHCSPYHGDSVLHPVIEGLKDSLGITHDTSDLEKLERLRRALGTFNQAGQDLMPMMASLLSLQMSSAPATSSPQEQKQQTLEALAAYVELMAIRRPVVLVVEDLHWVDPTTSELLDLIVEYAPGLPLLVLLTFRPEYKPPARWMALESVSQLALAKLGRSDVEQMVLHLTGGKVLPPAVLDEIYAKTDGFPLFVEDLTRMVIESDLLHERNGVYELVGPFQSLSIPDTLYETIMARLARLATAKPVAQLGATLGREFVYEMLRAVAPLDDERLKHELDRLVGAGLLYRRGLLSRAKYIFKHALVQEALHESLLKRQRKQYHKLVAEVLEEKFPDVVRNEPELVARHFAEADGYEKAAGYYLAAAQRAQASSANPEVLGHVSNALTMLEHLDDDDARAARELELRCAQGNAMVAMRGWASAETGNSWRRARELCERVPGAPQLKPVLKGLYLYNLVSGRTLDAVASAHEMDRKAAESGDPLYKVESLAALCQTYFWAGRYTEAKEFGLQGLELYDAATQHLEHVSRFAEDPGATLYTFVSMSLAVLGLEDQAERFIGQALVDYDIYTHVHSRCYLLAGTMFAKLQMRKPDEVMELSAKLMALATEHRFPGWLGLATPMRGWAMTTLGQVDEGIAMIQAGRKGWRDTGGRTHSSQWPALIAESYLATGRFDDAAAWLETGYADANATSEDYYRSELARLQGELAVLTGRPEAEAEEAFLRSLDIARRQAALAFELRTEVSYCEMLRQKNRDAARARLEAVMGRFTEGFESWDMRRARGLMERLGPTPSS